MTRSIARTSLSGPRHLLLGFRLLLRPGVRSFMLIPLLGNILLYTLAAGLAFYGLDSALDRWLPASIDWLRLLLYPLLGVLLLVLAFLSFTLIGSLILAPFNGLLSQRVERALTGTVTSAADETVAAAMGRSTRQALWRLGFVVLRVAGVFLIGLIPVVGIIAVPVGVLLGAWLLALEFSDGPIGNWAWEPTRQHAFMHAHRGGMIAFGLSVMALSLVPVLNLALIPAAVAGMTAYCLRLREADGSAPMPAPTPSLPD